MHRFGKAERISSTSKFVTPSPDAYQRIIANYDKKGLNKDSCTFGMKTLKFCQLNNNPGPGAHYIENINQKGLGFTVGKGPRSSQCSKLYTDQYYDTPNIFSGPRIGFGSEKRIAEFKKSKLPGPGSYNLQSSVGDIPTYLLKANNI